MNENAPTNKPEEEVDMSYVEMAGGKPSVMDTLKAAQESGDPAKVAEAQVAADEKYTVSELMGPPKELYNESMLNSEKRARVTQELAQDLEALKTAVDANKETDFARTINYVRDNLETLWQPRVRRELSGGTAEEGYKAALGTPEAQHIYAEELAKFELLKDPSLKPLMDTLRSVQVANYRGVNEDDIAKELTALQKRKANSGGYSGI
jgi:hypothetical protein